MSKPVLLRSLYLAIGAFSPLGMVARDFLVLSQCSTSCQDHVLVCLKLVLPFPALMLLSLPFTIWSLESD